MGQFRLTPGERRRLQGLLKDTSDARVYRRSLALLELARGRSVVDVAAGLGVSRQTLYNWQAAYAQGGGGEALFDAPRSGRPSVWSEEIEAVLSTALAEPPERWGYRATGWTAGLVQQHIARWTGQQISESAIRQHLHDLGYAWKRFRYVLEPDAQREKKAGDSAPSQSARASPGGAV